MEIPWPYYLHGFENWTLSTPMPCSIVSNIVFFWRARVCWQLLCLCRRYPDSNPESCSCKQARYLLCHPSPSNFYMFSKHGCCLRSKFHSQTPIWRFWQQYSWRILLMRIMLLEYCSVLVRWMWTVWAQNIKFWKPDLQVGWNVFIKISSIVTSNRTAAPEGNESRLFLNTNGWN